MKIMNLVFHPDLGESRVNSTWKKQLEESGKITTSRDMYSEYSDFQIDIDREQKLLLEHDRIVFQFPMYWWSVPPLLKQWLDDVLQYQFAYGSKGDKQKARICRSSVPLVVKQKISTAFICSRPFQNCSNRFS